MNTNSAPHVLVFGSFARKNFGDSILDRRANGFACVLQKTDPFGHRSRFPRKDKEMVTTPTRGKQQVSVTIFQKQRESPNRATPGQLVVARVGVEIQSAPSRL